jgi:hypothetical protein
MPKIGSKPAMRTIAHSLSVGTVAGGKPGPPTGVTLFDAADRALVSIALVAVTVNLLAVPLVSPVIT